MHVYIIKGLIYEAKRINYIHIIQKDAHNKQVDIHLFVVMDGKLLVCDICEYTKCIGHRLIDESNKNK